MNTLNALLAYFRGATAEVRKVSWPSWQVLVRYFLSVVIGAALATAFIGGLDYVFLKALAFILK